MRPSQADQNKALYAARDKVWQRPHGERRTLEELRRDPLAHAMEGRLSTRELSLALKLLETKKPIPDDVVGYG